MISLSICRSFTRFFQDTLINGRASFQDLGDSIKQTFGHVLSEMATEALVNPIIVPMVYGFKGAINGLTSGFGGGLANIGNSGLFSGGLLTGGTLPNWLGTGEAFGGGDFIGSASDSIFGGGGLAGVLGGFGIGALAGGLIGGNSLVSGGLGAIGALLGGPLGGLAGGLLGGAMGNFGASNQGAISNFTNGGLGNTLFKAGGGNNGQLATTATGTVNTALKTLQDAGVNVSLGNISGLSIGSDKSYVYDFAGGKQKLAGGEAGVQATVNAILDRILPSASSGDSVVSELLAKYGGLNSGNLGAFSTELQAVNDKKAQDAADAATAATKALVDQFNTLGDDLKNFAGGLQDSAKAARDAANDWQKARDSLDKARTALLISAPGLSPTEQYRNSRQQFDSLLNSARGGNSQSASDLASFSSQFLQSSYGYNGSTTAYAGDLSYVKDTLSGLSGFSEAQRSYAQRQADSLDAAVAQLSAIYDAISNAANQNNDGLGLLREELADLKQSIKDGNLQARMAS